jgi:hypothetical protein
LGVQNDLYTFNSGGHAIPITGISETAAPFISDFLYNIICETVSVNDISVSTKTNIYPNPASETLNIDNHMGGDKILIFDNFGRKVMESEIRGLHSKILVSSLNDGLYHLQIFNQSGLLSNKRFVKTNFN